MNNILNFKRVSISSNIKKIFLYLFQVISSNVIIFGFSSPLGLSFYLASQKYVNKSIFLIMYGISLYITQNIFYALKIMFVILIYNLVKVNLKKDNIVVQAFLISIFNFIISIGFLWYIDDINIYTCFKCGIEMMLIMSAAIVFNKGVKAFIDNDKYYIYSFEEKISLIFIYVFFLMSLNNLFIINISILFLIGVISMLLATRSGGSLIGLGSTGLLILAYALSGEKIESFYSLLFLIPFISGIFNRFGKVFMLFVFNLIYVAIVLISFKSSNDITMYLRILIIADVIFLFIPKNVFNQLNYSFKYITYDNTNEMIKNSKEEVMNTLKEYSKSFIKLGNMFEKITKNNDMKNKQEIEEVFSNISSNVCLNCEHYSRCWEKHFYFTNKSIYEILNSIEKRGKIDIDDISSEFKNRCLNLNMLVNNINRIIEVNKINTMWFNKVKEGRKMLSEHLYEVSNVIGNITKEINKSSYSYKSIERLVEKSLNSEGVYITKIKVIEYQNKQKIELIIKNMKVTEIGKVIEVIEDVLGYKFKILSYNDKFYKFNKELKLLLVEQEKYNILSYAKKVRIKNKEVSGDNYSVIEMSDNNIAIALADGIGSGLEAYQESELALELIEKLINNKFNIDFVINMINSMLIFNSNKELYTTLDMCIVNKNIGNVKFIKIGSFTTFIIRKDKIETIKSNSLPMGMFNKIEPKVCDIKLENNDIVVMMSDGILIPQKSLIEVEEFVIKSLYETYNNSVNEIVNHLEEKINNEFKDKIDDDLTIIVYKMVENS